MVHAVFIATDHSSFFNNWLVLEGLHWCSADKNSPLQYHITIVKLVDSFRGLGTTEISADVQLAVLR